MNNNFKTNTGIIPYIIVLSGIIQIFFPEIFEKKFAYEEPFNIYIGLVLIFIGLLYFLFSFLLKKYDKN